MVGVWENLAEHTYLNRKKRITDWELGRNGLTLKQVDQKIGAFSGKQNYCL